MLRILTPDCLLKEIDIDDVVPVKELRVDFNGSTRRLVERVNLETTKPNGVAMRPIGVNPQRWGCDEFFVGNLRQEMVWEIIRKLLKDKYFDFSTMQFQERVNEIRETVCDDAKSLPYVSSFVSGYLDSGVFESTCGCSVDPFATTVLPMQDIGSFGGSSFDEDFARMSQMPVGVG